LEFLRRHRGIQEATIGQHRLHIGRFLRLLAAEAVPIYEAWSDVLKLLNTPDRSTVAGRRDYAILLLLAVYGLRASEVVALSLEDVDWRRNQLRIRHTKGGERTWYPLHPEVGEAIQDYVRHGRPHAASPRIFFALRRTPPVTGSGSTCSTKQAGRPPTLGSSAVDAHASAPHNQ
jgi:integrase